MSWSARFHRPVVLPGGRKLTTLSDARAYILGLPKAKQHTAAVEAAAEAVLMAAEERGPMMHAEIAMAHLAEARK